MFSIGFQFSRSFFTRTTLYSQIQIQRKILDKYERGIVDRKKQKAFVESMYEFLKLIIEQHQRNYNEQLARAIVERTESYKEWEYEIDKAKREIFRKYVDMEDESHPFLVDDYRMELVKEMRRIDKFYEPLIEREADELKVKRDRGLIHIEPEPFHLEGLADVIPLIHKLISDKPEELEEPKKNKKLIT